MRNTYLSLMLPLMALLAVSCGPKKFTGGKYDDPEKVILLDDKFNENDMQLVSNKLVDSLSEHVKKTGDKRMPVVMVGRVRNRTSEHIDVKALTDKIRTDLIKAGNFRFASKEARAELSEEYDYEASGAVSEETQKVRGRQIGIDYLITGDVASNVQEVGNDKVVYYKVTLNLINLETNIIEWSDDREVRKRYRKRHVGF